MADDSRKTLFDRKMGALYGVPDVLSTTPTTIQVAVPMVGDTETFIVQTYRGKDPAGDTVFLQHVNSEGTVRIALPPAVTSLIARQRDSLGARARRRAAKAAAADRKARGIMPAFLNRKK